MLAEWWDWWGYDFNKMAREDLTDKVIFEQNPKAGEEASHVDGLRGQHCRRRKQDIQSPGVGEYLVLQVTASEGEIGRYNH